MRKTDSGKAKNRKRTSSGGFEVFNNNRNFAMANSHAQDALVEVDSFLQSRVHEHLKIDVDSTEYPAKDHAQREKKRPVRKWVSWGSSSNRHHLHRINDKDSMSKRGNYGRRNDVRKTAERFGSSVSEEPRTYWAKGRITSSLGIGDSGDCVAASLSNLVPKEKELSGLRQSSPAALLPAVNDASIDKRSAHFSVKIPLFVERVRQRKVKPLSHDAKHSVLASTCDPYLKKMEEKNEMFEQESKQAVERSSVCEQEFSKVTLADNKSKRKQRNRALDATKHASLAVLNKEDNSLKVSHLSPERAPLAFSRRKLLILDVNGLLADIVSPPPKECKSDINISRRAIFKRPFCHDFLKFCFERFDIGIWSSRTKKIIDRVVDYLLGDMKYKLLFCWDLSHCTGTGFKTLENKHKEMVFKELRKLWEKHDTNLPWRKGDYNESNTLLLDDSPYKALLNPMHTAIFPYSYNFKDESDNSLGPQGDIRVYLQDLAAAEDIHKYVQEHPFGQRAIDETCSSWGYYNRVISTRSLVLSRR